MVPTTNRAITTLHTIADIFWVNIKGPCYLKVVGNEKVGGQECVILSQIGSDRGDHKIIKRKNSK